MIDANLIYAESKDMAAAVGDHDSATLVHGDGSSSAGIADGNPLDLHIMMNEDATSAGAATVQWEMMHRDPGGAWESTGLVTKAFPVADLVAGKIVFEGPIPHGLKDETKLIDRIGTAALTAGKYTGYLNAR